MKQYTEDELRKLFEDAERRGDKAVSAALITLGMIRSHDDRDAEEELIHLLKMFAGYLVAKNNVSNEGGNHGQADLTAIDPDTVYQL